MRYRGMSRAAGFTLVELSIVIIIVGLLTAGGLAVGASMVERASYIDTQKLIKQLQRSVKDFYIVNGHLPCVASLEDAPGSAAFGVANPDCATSVAVPSGTFRTGAPAVRVGMVPVRTLGLPDSAASDKYGNRITYAVSEQLTDANQFGSQAGGITVWDMNDNPVLSDAAFYIGSPGRDRKGAYNYATGNVDVACGTSDNLDVESCEFSNAIFRDAPFNNGDVEGLFFDDLTAWTPKFHLTGMNVSSDTLWAANGDANLYNVGTDSNTANTNVGIGVATPAAKLHVAANANALRLQGNDHVYIEYYADGAATRSGFIGYRSSVSNDLTLGNEIANANIILEPDVNGRVGIGTTNPTLGKLQVTGGPIYVGNMWLGQSGATNTAPDIQCNADCMMTADGNLRFGIDGSNSGSGSYLFYRGGHNTVDGTLFARLNRDSSFHLGQDGNGGDIYGSSARDTRLGLFATSDGYDYGGAITVHGRNSSFAGQVRYYTQLGGGQTEGHHFLRRAGGSTDTLFLVRANGNTWTAGTSGGPSDERLKTDIKPLTGMLDKLDRLQGVSFRWNGKGGQGDLERQHLGVIAQNVQEVFPEQVSEGPDGYLSLDKTEFIAPLIEGVKALHAENKALREDLSALRAEVSGGDATEPVAAEPRALRPLDIILLLGLGVMILLYARNRKA